MVRVVMVGKPLRRRNRGKLQGFLWSGLTRVVTEMKLLKLIYLLEVDVK